MMRNIGKLLLAGVLAASLCLAVIGCAGGDTTGKSQYDVYYMTDAAYTITGEKTVKAGEDYTFTVTPAAGYDASAMKVTANGKTLTAKDGKYTVAKVEDTLAIYVTGIVASAAPETEYVNVTFEGEHVDFTGDSKTVKGEDYEFTAVAYDGYNLVEVKNGDEVLMAIDGVYTVEAEADIAITATAEAVVKYDLKTVAGDTPSVGGTVYTGEDNKTHIKVEYNNDDRFYKDETKTDFHYQEVGFGLTDEAWAKAPVGANYVIVTLKINTWGTMEGSSIWSVEEGMANLGFGTMKWPGCDSGTYPDGSIKMLGISKGQKFVVRNSDKFDATVLSVEFKTMSEVGTVGAGQSANLAKDEYGNIYLTNAGGADITIDLTLVLGDACKGKSIRFDIVRLDGVNGKRNAIGPIEMSNAKTCNFTANADDEGKITLGIDQMVGLYQITVSIVG